MAFRVEIGIKHTVENSGWSVLHFVFGSNSPTVQFGFSQLGKLGSFIWFGSLRSKIGFKLVCSAVLPSVL